MRYNWSILGKLTCPWCDKAADLLRKHGEEYTKVNFESSPVMFRLLMKKCDLTTVPQIWYGDTYVGGYEDLKLFLEKRDAG